MNRKEFLAVCAGTCGTVLAGKFWALESPHDVWQRGVAQAWNGRLGEAEGLMARAAGQVQSIPRLWTRQYANLLCEMGVGAPASAVVRLRQMVGEHPSPPPRLKGNWALVELQTGHFEQAATLAQDVGVVQVGTLGLSALAGARQFEAVLAACDRVRKTPGLHPAYDLRAHQMALQACHALGRPVDPTVFLRGVSKLGFGAGPVDELLWLTRDVHEQAEILAIPRRPALQRLTYALATALYRSPLPPNKWQPRLDRSIDLLGAVPEAAGQLAYLKGLRHCSRAPGRSLVAVDVSWKWLSLLDPKGLQPLLRVPARLRERGICNLPGVNFQDNVMMPEGNLAIFIAGRNVAQFSAKTEQQVLVRFETELTRVVRQNTDLISNWKAPTSDERPDASFAAS